MAVEAAYCVDDFVQLRLLELRINRQRNHFLTRPLALGECAPLAAEILEARLKVQRKWVVDGCSDLLVAEMSLQPVAMGNAKSVLIVDRLVGGIDGRRPHV